MDESDPAHSSGGVAAEIGDEEMVGFDAQVGARKCVVCVRLTDDVVLNNHRFLLIVAYGKRGLVKLPLPLSYFLVSARREASGQRNKQHSGRSDSPVLRLG